MHSIRVQVSRGAPRELRLSFVLTGDLGRLRIPPPAAPCTARELWRQTCFEAFVGVAGSGAYHELNLAPSGEWAVYAFDRYRERASIRNVHSGPRIVVAASHGELELDALIDPGALSPTYATAPLRIALATVVEETSGALSYWALRHPPGAPDFHHPDAFALRLELPHAAC